MPRAKPAFVQRHKALGEAPLTLGQPRLGPSARRLVTQFCWRRERRQLLGAFGHRVLAGGGAPLLFKEGRLTPHAGRLARDWAVMVVTRAARGMSVCFILTALTVRDSRRMAGWIIRME